MSERALELDRQIDFDLVHHVTLASYWTRAGAAVLDKPFVWGPVGGGVDPPLSLIPELGARGQIAGVARDVGRPIAARFPSSIRIKRGHESQSCRIQTRPGDFK